MPSLVVVAFCRYIFRVTSEVRNRVVEIISTIWDASKYLSHDNKLLPVAVPEEQSLFTLVDGMYLFLFPAPVLARNIRPH